MRLLIITPEPATSIKPRVFRIAQLLTQAYEVHVAFVSDIFGRNVPGSIRLVADRQLEAAGVHLHEISGHWSHAGFEITKNLLQGKPFRVALYDRKQLKQQVEHLVQSINPDILHIDRERAFPLSTNILLPKIVDLTDPIGWYLESRSRISKLTIWSSLLAGDAAKMWLYERSIVDQTSAVLFASDVGVDRFRAKFPELRVFCVPNPLPATASSEKDTVVLPGTRPHLIFTGNLYYPANVQSACWLVDSVLPAIKSRFPTATLHLAGCRPHRKILSLARKPDVYVHADPTDMGHLLRSADIALAPLLLSAGFPNKICDAAMAGIPVIASPQAICGLPEEIRRFVPTAEAPDEWAVQLENICTDVSARAAVVNRLQAAIQAVLNDQAILDRLMPIYQSALKPDADCPA